MIARHDEFQAAMLHDPVTKLPGPTLLADRVEHAVGRCNRHRTTMVLLSIALVRYEGFCQTFGEALGNALLTGVAQRLGRATRSCDTVSRVGRSNFVLVLEDVAPAVRSSLLVERIAWLFEIPFVVSGMEVEIAAQVRTVPLDGYQPDDAAAIERHWFGFEPDRPT